MAKRVECLGAKKSLASEFGRLGGRIAAVTFGAAQKPHVMDNGENGGKNVRQFEGGSWGMAAGGEKALLKTDPVIKEETSETGSPASTSLAVTEGVVERGKGGDVEAGGGENRIKTGVEDIEKDRDGGALVGANG